VCSVGNTGRYKECRFTTMLNKNWCIEHKKRKAWKLLRNGTLTPLKRCLLQIIIHGTVRHAKANSPYNAVPLPCCSAKCLDLSFPFDLYSAAVFDSHMPCRSYAVPMPCHEYAILKATSQGNGTARHGNGMVCVK
jgi:hypothetical protein